MLPHPFQFFDARVTELTGSLARRCIGTKLFALLTVLLLAGLCWAGPARSEGVRVSFLYKLSDFFGAEPFSWPRVFPDPVTKEILVTHQNAVRIFDANGMEIYRFGDDEVEPREGSISDAVADPEGNILLLTHQYRLEQRSYAVIRCNYRGEPQAKIEFKEIPADFSGKFFPDSMVYRNGRLYLCDSSSMRVLVADARGTVERTIDIQKLMKTAGGKPGQQLDITGFNVDGEGNILFTVSVLFRAFRLAPDDTLTGFGQRGSSPGKFNLASGIAADDNGYYYVSDRLKCAVLVFDKNLAFVAQFGYRGYSGEGLIVPADVSISGNRLFVTQAASMGVSVFSIEH